MSAHRNLVVTAAGDDDDEPEIAEPFDTEKFIEAQNGTAAPEKVAEADGSIAARIKAKAEQLRSRTKRIAVPPDDVWEGELMLVVRPVALKGNIQLLKLIADATDHLEMFDSRTSQWDTVEGGWVGLGRIMGVSGDRVTVGQIITAVCSSTEVANGLAEQIVAFIAGRQSKIEQALGE